MGLPTTTIPCYSVNEEFIIEVVFKTDLFIPSPLVPNEPIYDPSEGVISILIYSININ